MFDSLSVLAILAAAALLLLRSPLPLILAAFSNVLIVIVLFVLLQVPLLALIQFCVLLVLFVGLVQLVRGVGPERFRTPRRLHFGQVVGLLVSVLLGVLVLVYLTSLAVGEAVPVTSRWRLGGWDMQEGMLLGLGLLLIVAALLSFRRLKRLEVP